MTKINPAFFSESLKTPPTAIQIWRAARTGIIFRALLNVPQNLQKGLQVHLKISDEQLKRVHNTGNVPQEMMVRLAKEAQNRKSVQNLLLWLANLSLSDWKLAEKEERLDPWESALRLILLAQELDFEHPWLESEEALEDFLNSEDSGVQDCLDNAWKLLFAAADINSFTEKVEPEFYKNISAQLPDLGDRVEDLRQFQKLNESLHKISLKKRDFLRGVRSFRKVLRQPLLRDALGALEADLDKGDIWDFIKVLNRRSEEFIKVLREAAFSYLPAPFDSSEIRKALERVMPAMPAKDLALMDEELREIEERVLAQADSQLLSNILPALLGEKPFNMDAFEEAMDRSAAKEYSHKFIRHLAAGDYLIPEDEEDAEEEPDESASEARTPLEPEEAEPLEEAYEEGVPEPDATVIDAFSAVEEAGPEEDEQDNAPESQSGDDEASDPAEAAQADGFAFMEDSLSAPPQPGGFAANSAPESMTIEQAIEFSIQEESGEGEEPDLEEEEAMPASGDPLERKFQMRKRLEESGDKPADGMNSFSMLGRFAHRDRTAEKKSPEFGEERQIRTEAEAEQKLSFRQFIHSIANGKSAEPPEAEEGKQTENLRALLAQGEQEAFFHLCNGLGPKSPYHRDLAELLYLGAQYMPGKEEMSSRLFELIDLAIEESERFSEEENLLLAAAIIKPALMLPNENMRTVISILSGKLAHYGLSSFFNALENFISRRISLDPSIFTGQSESRLIAIRLESLQQQSRDFLYRMRNSKTSYQPASLLRKKLYGQTGLLGAVLEKCMEDGQPDLISFLAEYDNEKGMEKIIDSTELPHRNRIIEANARKRILSEIRQAMKLLEAWNDYYKYSSVPANKDYSVQKFFELFEKLPGEMDRLHESVEGRILAARLKELSECPKKPLASGSENPQLSLRLWPLRLPHFDASYGALKKPSDFLAWLMAKKHKDNDFVAASLVTQLGAGRLTDCRAFLDQYPEIRKVEPDMGAMSGGLLPARGITVEKYHLMADSVWEEMFQELVENVKSYIVACEFRGVLHTHQPARYLDQLARLTEEVEESGDKARGVASLEEIRRDLVRMGESELEQIQEKIRDLEARDDLSPECRQRLALIRERHLADMMLNLAWNELAEITDHLAKGQPLNDLPAEASIQDSAAHTFFELLERGEAEERTAEASSIWNAATSSLQARVNRGRLGPAGTKAIADFMRWLGFTLDQSQQPEVMHSSPAPNFWRVISLKMEISGPLPQWSKRKTRHLAAFGWNVRPEDINQLLQANFMDYEDCKTIICFNKLNFEARQKLMALCGQRNIAPLIVDENLFNFLSGYDVAARTEALFRVGLTGAGIIPYVDVGGAVPREMFFGRKDDIRALLDPMGPCIVYGGRQLGKSALLQQIHNNPRPGIKTVLHSMSNSESSLLDAIRYECEQAGIVHPGTQKKNLSAQIKRWLNENRDWRILVLLDECDRVLDLDRQNDFAEITELRNLMNDTQRRFKVVITGLHSVQRFSQITNQPFLHFGDPLCIGPLSSNAAFELMTAPMSYLGVEFANEQLVQLALNHCGYQPKLIQIFCMELLKALHNRRKTPFETIDDEGIQKIYGSRNLKKKIVECFDMTLNLDDRYLVIGYVLAINYNVKMDLNHLLQELKYYWPDAFGDRSGGAAEMLNSLRSLLHEMEGLGLVTRLDNEYMLRTPNIIDLLGGIDQILTKLDPYATREYKPVVGLDDLRMRDYESLVASQFNQLTEKSNGLHWISGNAALGVDQIAATLKKIVDEENRYNPIHKLRLVKLSGATEHELFQMLRQKYDSLEGGMICWLSASEFAFTDKFMLKARDWLERLRTGRKYVKIICIIDPVTLYDFIATGHAENFSDSHIPLLPWSHDGLAQYYKESGQPGGPGIDQMLRESQGWPMLVRRYFSPSQSQMPPAMEDFWNGDGKAARELVKFIANELGGRLEKESLQEDAAVMLDMFPQGVIREVSDMLNWINTLHSLFILRDDGKHLLLDPVARDAILEARAS